MSDTGTYTLSGNAVSITSSSGTTNSSDYCIVKGTTLHLVSMSTAMSMGTMGQATIATDIVATKQ